MRQILGFFAAILFLYHPAEGADKVRVAYTDLAGHFVTFPLAQKKGFLKEEGFDAELVRMGARVASIALAAGQIDYFTSIGDSVQAAVGGLPIKVVAGYLPAMFALISRPEFKSVMELKGKTMGVSILGNTPHVIARMLMKHFGLDPETGVKFINTGGPEGRLAKLQQGLTAATVLPVPADLLGMKMGFITLARFHDLLSFPEGGLVASTKTIKERPEEVKRLIRAGIKASRYILSNREGTIQFLMEWERIDNGIAAAAYDALAKAVNVDGSVPERGLRLVMDEARKATRRSHELSISAVENLSILREAQRELGIAAR